MEETRTYIRVNMNGRWTNLGIIAEEKDIKEHFHFVEELLGQKARADMLQRQIDSLKEFIPSLASAVESTLDYSNPYVEEGLQRDIGAYSSLMEQIYRELRAIDMEGETDGGL